MSDLTGQTIKGYELGECLGTGAFGAVYRAYQPQLERHVAVKIILGEHANRPDFIRRFEFEARIIAQLEHLHIVPLYDYWREPDGAYLIMRLMPGGSLADLLEHGPLNPGRTLELVRQIGRALEAAHQRGIVHRDIKPANILLDEEGNAYLSDFGIAKDVQQEEGMTQTGAILGTPAYLTPEQAQSGAITPQTDIYSLGVILYEMLVGGHPFPDTPTGGLLVKHIQEPLPSLTEVRPELPLGLDEVIQRATAKEPGARYESVLELVADLERALETVVDLVPDQEEELDAPNPYKGLRAFQEADAQDFYGRDQLVGQLLARLMEPVAQQRFLAVVGPSGSGKSSVVKAGLLPALRKGAVPGSEHWYLVAMTPGNSPFEELEQELQTISVTSRSGLLDLLRKEDGLNLAARLVLPSDNDQLLVVIDQFEEVYTLVERDSKREAFLHALLAALEDPASPLSIVITLRADFYDRPLMHPEFGPLLESRTQIVLPLNPEEITAAVRGPAGRLGAQYEPGLVNKILGDVSHQPGSLPLLQYALTELYERREGHQLTHQAYQEMGGVLGALGWRAEEVYSGLDEANQQSTRQVFLRLITLGEGVKDTRRRVLQSELEELLINFGADKSRRKAKLLRRLLEIFGQARLISFDRDPVTRGPTVEVAHEALLREWPRLRRWLDDSRVDLRMQRVLGRAAREWEIGDREPSFLLRGGRLEQYAGWVEATDLALTGDERSFLEASLRAKREREAEEAARLAREQALEQRSRRILRTLVGVFALAAVVAAVLSIFAFNQRSIAQAESEARATQQVIAEEQRALAEQEAQAALEAQAEAQAQAAIAATNEVEAEMQRDLAEREAQIALARELAAAAIVNSNLEADPELGLLLALQAAAITLDQDGFITTEAEDALHQALSWALPMLIMEKSVLPLGDLALSPSGVHLAVSGAIEGEGTEAKNWIHIWDTTTKPDWDLVQTIKGSDAPVRALAYNHDSTLLAAGSQSGIIKIWETDSGKEQNLLQGHRGMISGLDFSPDGSLLASASVDGTARIWDIAGDGEIFVLQSHEGEVTAIRFSPDGNLVATGSLDQTIKIWDRFTGLEVRTLHGHSNRVYDLIFAPDGKTLITGSEDGVVIIWDVSSGNEIRTVCCHRNVSGDGILSLAISPSGEFIITGGPRGGDFKTWSFSGEEIFTLFHSAHGDVMKMAFSPSGSRLFTFVRMDRRFGGAQNPAPYFAWDYSFGRELAPLTLFEEAVIAVAYNPAGTHLATVDATSEIRIWELLSDQTQASPLYAIPEDAHAGEVHDLAFSPDDATLATAGADREVKLWGLGDAGVEEKQTFSGHTGEVFSVTFSPDGSTLASASADRTAILWNLANPAEQLVLRGHTESVLGIVFNSDGGILATASADGTTRIWDAATGQTTLTLRGHEGAVHSVAFSPDSTLLLTAGADGTARVWEMVTGEEVLSLSAHDTGVNRAAFTSDGLRIITSGADGVSKVWEAATGRELFVLSGHDDAILDLDLLADGSRMVTASADGTVNFYFLDPLDLYAYAQTRVTRSWTEDECQRYLHMETCPAMPGSE